MSNSTLILIYLIVSLLFLMLVGLFLKRIRKREEDQFEKYYPFLVEELKKGNFDEVLLTLDKLRWNPNMNKQYLVDVLNELKCFDSKENKKEIDLIISTINEIFMNKGWKMQE